MRSELRPTLVVLALVTMLTGVVYPLAVTGVARVLFARQAAGSLIVRDGHAVGSRLIGQSFSGPQYFWGRLSATSPAPYNAAASSGSNLGPLNPALLDAARARIAALHAADPAAPAALPVDLVTASGSGLDPDVSPAAAEAQVARVARARGLSEPAVRDLVRQHTEGRTWGVLGEPRVHVLELNLALDAVQASPSTTNGSHHP
jgi:K+-transporting ATPase ATPase C chain